MTNHRAGGEIPPALSILLLSKEASCRLFAAFAQEMRQQHAFRTPTAQETTADQEAHELRVVVAFAFGGFVIAFEVVVPGFASLPQEMPEQHALGTPTAQETTADHEPYELGVIVPFGRLIIALILTFRFAA